MLSQHVILKNFSANQKEINDSDKMLFITMGDQEK